MERWLGRYSEWIYAVARIVIGFLFAAHGAQKLFGGPGGPPMTGNAYADDAARVPHTLHDALDLWEKSELAREAFGAEVVEHYANYARVELTAYEAAVTDWELRRGFERL